MDNHEYTMQKKISFRLFELEQKVVLKNMYPFLSKVQINRRVKEKWNKLQDEEKKQYSKTVISKTPTKSPSRFSKVTPNKDVSSSMDKNCLKAKKERKSIGIPVTKQRKRQSSPHIFQSLKNRNVCYGEKYENDFICSPSPIYKGRCFKEEYCMPERGIGSHIGTSPVERIKGDMLMQRNYLKGKPNGTKYKAPEMMDETPCKQTGILKAFNSSSEQKQKGRVSFSSQPKVETYSQDIRSNDSITVDSDDEACAALIRRSDTFSQHDFDDIEKFSMCVETEDGIVHNLTNGQIHPTDIQIVDTTAAEDFLQTALSDCMNPFGGNTDGDINTLADDFSVKENKKKKDKIKRGRKKGNTAILSDLPNNSKKTKRKYGNQIDMDCSGTCSESDMNIHKFCEDSNVTSKSPSYSSAAENSNRGDTCKMVEDSAENPEKGQRKTRLKLPYRGCLSSKLKSEGDKVYQKTKNTRTHSEDSEICTHKIGTKTQSCEYEQDTIAMKENYKDTKRYPRVLRYSLRNSAAGTHLKEVTDQETFDSESSSVRKGHDQVRGDSDLHFHCSYNAYIPQTKSDTGKLKDVTPIQINAANKSHYVTPEQTADKTDTYATPVMEDHVQQETIRAVIKSPRKQKPRSKYASSTAEVIQPFDKKVNERDCAKKARASLLEDYVGMECMTPAGDAGIKTLDKENYAKNLDRIPLEGNVNMGLKIALGDDTAEDGRDSDDSYEIQDAEYSELLTSDLGYDGEDDEVSVANNINVSNETTGNILYQALQKLKQATRNSPVPSSGSSPRLLSPTLSGISQLSNESSSSSVTKSSVQYPSSIQVPVSINRRTRQQNDNTVQLTKDVKDPGLCSMFQNMTPPQRKTKAEGNRRVIASAKQETSSNFKNMFREQAIFD